MNERVIKKRLGGGFRKHEFFNQIISLENLFLAWREFKKGKLKKQDVSHFAVDAEEEIFKLNKELKNFSYRHGDYTNFIICDPKRREVSKAIVRDRLLHHAIFRILEPVFDRIFIYDSFSSRKGKGIHKAHERFHTFAWRLSRNNTREVWVLKCDIKRFFDSTDHAVLLRLLGRVVDSQTLELLKGIILSFEKSPGKGMPIGNLTSQLFSNIYMNEFDQFMKRELRIKHYIRYADDFVVLSPERAYLKRLLPDIITFLSKRLALHLHPEKVTIKKWRQGADFLGYVLFPSHCVLRTRTKQRVLRKLVDRYRQYFKKDISPYSFNQTLASYLGMLTHCRSVGLRSEIRKRLEAEKNL